MELAQQNGPLVSFQQSETHSRNSIRKDLHLPHGSFAVGNKSTEIALDLVKRRKLGVMHVIDSPPVEALSAFAGYLLAHECERIGEPRR